MIPAREAFALAEQYESKELSKILEVVERKICEAASKGQYAIGVPVENQYVSTVVDILKQAGDDQFEYFPILGSKSEHGTNIEIYWSKSKK